jgi:hypothetical protein
MILTAYTLLHVLISLVGIATGFVVLSGMIKPKELSGWTAVFLTTTVATSVTGFGFPVDRFMPSHAFGILSLILLALAIYALYSRQLVGAWRPTYVITAVFAQYLNVFVLIVQSFQNVPFLHALAPTQNEPPFAVAQLATLVAFLVLGTLAVRRFRPTRPAAV